MRGQLASRDTSCQLAGRAIDNAALFWTAPVLEGDTLEEDVVEDREDPEDEGVAAELDPEGLWLEDASGSVPLCELRTMPMGVTFPVELGEFT